MHRVSALHAPLCPARREASPEEPHVDDEHAVVKNLVVGHAHHVLVDINGAVGPLNPAVHVDGSQLLIEARIETVEIVEECPLRSVTCVARAVKAEHDPAGFDAAKVVFLHTAKMTKVLPEGAQPIARAECEIGGVDESQEVSREATSESPLRLETSGQVVGHNSPTPSNASDQRPGRASRAPVIVRRRHGLPRWSNVTAHVRESYDGLVPRGIDRE